VILEDSLGIADDLDAAMARHVDTYVDEWRATLEDPEKLKRFSAFINAPDEPDPDLAYVPERGQRRPATAGERAKPEHPGGSTEAAGALPSTRTPDAAVLIAGSRLEVVSR
jgi:nitrite reductase (NADH) large subunit